MAGTLQKRQRDEESDPGRIGFDESNSNSKRQNSFNSIISILDDEEEYEPDQDLSAIFSTLQQELSSLSSNTACDGATTFDFDYMPSTAEEAGLMHEHHQETGDGGSATSISGGGAEEEGEEDDGVRVMKHLLEASDDELGIPTRVDEEINSGDNPPFSSLDGLWEIEDETANYCTVLQSELLM